MKNKKPFEIPEVPATVHSLTHEGIGIAAVNEKTTFIEGALPQETVKYRIFKKRRHYDEAACIEVITASPERTIPQCPHFGICGGCSMQHLDISAQIKWKEKILLEQLAHIGHVTPDALLAPLCASPWEYRHKARLGVRYLEKHNKTVVGFRQKFRHQIADLDHCHVLHPSVGKRLSALSELISHLSCKDELPQIEVAVGDTAVALIFRHLISLSADDLTQLRHFGQQHQIHIYLQPNPPAPIALLWPENTAQRLSYRLPDFDIEILFHPSDFTQIHLEMNRLMVKQAVTLLDPQPHEKILDLFCGVGNFSLPLARRSENVTGIEGSPIMVERAYENAQHNAITNNVTFHTANLFAPIDEKPWFHQTYEKILLDPPRTGAKEIIDYFPKLAATRIVYVSCNPATLARDAHLLTQQGYRLKQAGIMNMFPHTSHIEAMAIFER